MFVVLCHLLFFSCFLCTETRDLKKEKGSEWPKKCTQYSLFISHLIFPRVLFLFAFQKQMKAILVVLVLKRQNRKH